MNLENLTEENLQEEIENITEFLNDLFLNGFPSQLPDKIQNVTTGLSEAFRIYGDIRQRLGAAIEAKDVIAAREAIQEAEYFINDTVRFFTSSTSVDDFRHNSYIWAKKHCAPKAAESMGVTEGTPNDYQ